MTFLIAEIGINHNGDMSVTKKLIDEAQIAGFDAVKFQKRNIDKVYSKKILDGLRDSPWGTTQREQKNGLEFDKSQYEEIDKYCKVKNITWFASAWETDSLDFLDQFNLKYNKIASAMIVDSNFLKQVALRKKHTFISTGMSTMEDIVNAVDIFKKNDCPFELMHCVSTYPCKPEDANLTAINSLKEKFNCKVGYSGHEKGGLAISVAAVALGATSIERHITLDRTMYGSDQAASLTPDGFKNLVVSIRKVEKAINGDEDKKILKIEEDVAKKLREHIKI
jgi:N-acetylneuraminate synthase